MFGTKKLMPKKDDDKKKKPKKQKLKLPKKKKGEKAPTIYPYAEYPPRKAEDGAKTRADNLMEEMEQPIFENKIVEEHCNPGVMPTIIKEIYYPPKSSEQVATLVESAIVYQNSANYEQALESFEQARDLW